MSNSHFLNKVVKSNLLGESCSLSDVTYGLFPCNPSIDILRSEYHIILVSSWKTVLYFMLHVAWAEPQSYSFMTYY